MRLVTWLSSGSLLVGLMACGTEPLVCAAAAEALTVRVRNSTDHALRNLRVTDTVRRTGAVLDFTRAGSSDFPAQAEGPVIIFTNDRLGELSRAGDVVTVAIAADDATGSGEFQLASDGCFVRRLAGPDPLIVR